MDNLDINNFGLFLFKSGYLSKKIWNQKNSEIFDWNKYNDILLSFEYNQKISITEASVKYGDTIQWINKIFKTDLTLEELYSQYIHYTSTNIPFICLLNNIIMISIILRNFMNIINQNNEDNINNIFVEQIIINDINLYSQMNNKNVLGIKQKLEFIYEKIKKNSAYNYKEVNRHLICILFLISMGSTFSVDNKISQIKNLMDLFTVNNKIFLNDINISLILFLSVIICINLCIYSNKKRSHFKFLIFDEFNYSNYFFKKIEPQKNSIEQPKDDINEHINLFLFDNDIIKYGGDNFSELLLFQNCLKIFSIHHLSKNQIKLTVYLTIDTIIETLKSFNDDISINQTNNLQNINFNINISSKSGINQIKLTNVLLLSKNNLNKCFSSFNFYELLIKATNFQEETQIQEINQKYSELIQKSRKFYLQNSISALQNNINNDNNKINEKEQEQNIIENNPSINYLKKEFNVLYYLLNYYHKNKEIKKNLQFYCFKFRFFKCSIFREPKKEIQLFFDYSSIKEKYLLYYLKDIENLLFLIKSYQEIINSVNEFKLYTIALRISQTNFRSRHINFFFTIIIKKLSFYIQENKLNRITLYDAKLKIYEDKMLVYIKDNSIKEKNRISSLKEMLNVPIFGNKLKVFNQYIKDLAEDWDIIILGQNIRYHNLIHSKNINILFLNITSENNDNSIRDLIFSLNPTEDSTQKNSIGISTNPYGPIDIKQNISKNEYLNIFMYIIKNEEFAEKILSFAEKLKDNNACVLKNKFTLICERFFFEETIIMNSRIKENSNVYTCIDNYLLVCDTIKEKEIFKYDLYITKNYVSLINYLSQEITPTFIEYINNFISVFSSCTELILYIYDKKEIDPNKFYFVQKMKRDYYCFEYKNVNFFVKKLNSFESLLLLNVKKSKPIFCLLNKEQSTEYEVNNSNFFDLFQRLFLNLNKVVKYEELNDNFFEKIHKNLFIQNYQNIIIMVFSYEAFFIFNDLFINNNYSQITKDEKFGNCYIIPYEVESQIKVKNFEKILENKKANKLIVDKIKIYDYNLTNTFIFNNRLELKMNFNKAEYFLENIDKPNNEQNLIKTKMKYIFKKIKSKEKKPDKNKIIKILKLIKDLYHEYNNIYFYSKSNENMQKFITDYNTEQIEKKTRKVDLGGIHN